MAKVIKKDINNQNNDKPVVTNNRKKFVGIVVSTKMQKTIVVNVQRKFLHPRFGKLVIQNTKLHAHDEKSECNVGDKVTIMETKPYSKTKKYCLISINERGQK